MSPDHAGRDRAGELVAGKYRLHHRLGAGGMAEVWSATNRFTERRVAIKLLDREADSGGDATARFLNEAKVTARVGHPNIVEVLDVGQAEDGQLFLVMELLQGPTLETALRQPASRLTLPELAHVMLDVAAALDAAHAAGIVHRDLKPSNVILHHTKDGIVPKVLDFGIGKFRGEADASITVAGTVLGSPLYMSPEQARGETDVDARSDIFAFGGILFEGLTGYRAYDARNFNALIVKIATSRPKDIDVEAPQFPASLRKVVRVCLEPDLQRRAKSFAEVRALLRAALPDLAVRDLPSVHRSSMPEASFAGAAVAVRATPRPSAWWPLACGAIAIGGMAIYSSRPTPTPAPTPMSTSSPTTTSAFDVVAAPAACDVTIDGVARGRTPVHVDELAPGEHAIMCQPPKGAARRATVTTGLGGPSRYRFLLE